MKAVKLLILALAILPNLSFAEEKVESPLDACKAKVAFQYHFDMMQIEGEELQGKIEHDAADLKKSARHHAMQGELAVCEDENKK